MEEQTNPYSIPLILSIVFSIVILILYLKYRLVSLLVSVICLFILTGVIAYLYFKNKPKAKVGVKDYSTEEKIEICLNFANYLFSYPSGWYHDKKTSYYEFAIEHPTHNGVFAIYLKNKLVENLRGIFYMNEPEKNKVLFHRISKYMNEDEIFYKCQELAKTLERKSHSKPNPTQQETNFEVIPNEL